MKNIFTCLFAIALVAGFSSQSIAQEREGGRRDRERGAERGERGERGEQGGARMMQAFPVLKALDANGDGELSAKEIKSAAEALRTLDKNEDGKLDAEEMRPSFGGRGGEGAGRAGRGGEGGGSGGRGGRGEPGARGAGGSDRGAAMVDRMMQADKDGDGKISKEEAPERMQSFFDRLDTNEDGFIEKSEIEAMASRMGGRGGRGGEAGGRGGRGGEAGGRGGRGGEAGGRGGEEGGRGGRGRGGNEGGVSGVEDF